MKNFAVERPEAITVTARWAKDRYTQLWVVLPATKSTLVKEWSTKFSAKNFSLKLDKKLDKKLDEKLDDHQPQLLPVSTASKQALQLPTYAVAAATSFSPLLTSST